MTEDERRMLLLVVIVAVSLGVVQIALSRKPGAIKTEET